LGVAIDSASRTVALAVPADPDFLAFARLALTGLVRLTRLRPDEAIDLKLALTEAAAGALDADEEPRPPPARLGFRFVLEPDRLVLEVDGWLSSPLSLAERQLGRSIIEATVDECETSDGSIRLAKHLRSPDPPV
jgi:hypothetical protein